MNKAQMLEKITQLEDAMKVQDLRIQILESQKYMQQIPSWPQWPYNPVTWNATS